MEIQKRYGLDYHKYYEVLVRLRSMGIKERLFDKPLVEIKGELPRDWEYFVKKLSYPFIGI